MSACTTMSPRALLPPVALVIAIAMCATAPARAQYLEEEGPRALGMGGAFVGVADDGYALYWNPGAMGWVGHQELAIGSTVGGAFATERNDANALYHFPLTDYHALGLAWRHSGDLDDGLDFASDRFSLAYGVRFGTRWGVGASARYLRESADVDGARVSDWSGWTGDLGVQYRHGELWAAGATLRNVIPLDVRHESGRGERLSSLAESWAIGASLRPWRDWTFAADLDDRLHVGSEYWWRRTLAARAGLTQPVRMLYGEEGEGPTFSLGFSARWSALKLDVARVMPPFVPATNRVGLGVEFQLTPSRVRVEKTEMDNVFASNLNRYADKPVARARLASKHEEPLAATLSLFVPGFMAAPTERAVVLRPKETRDVELSAIFSPDILRLAEDRPAQAEVRVSYQTKNRTRTERARTQFFMYRPGAISWTDLRSASAFVTAQDPAITGFARQLVQGGDPALDSGTLRNLFVAMRVFDALGAYGITYVPDPNNPFGRVSETRDAVDQIQYPRQLLGSRTGDCDDMSVLYCSLLENLGVPTAFLDGPGHILMLFDTGVHARNQKVLSVDEELVVVRDERVWIPVETTMIGRSFLDAWVEGAGIWRRWRDNPEARFVSVQDGWVEYQPAQPPGDPPAIAAPAPAEVARRFDADLDTLRVWQRTYLEEKYLKPLEESGNLDRTRDAGIQLAREGDFAGAETRLREVVAARETDAPAHNALGNVALLGGQAAEAIKRYRAAWAASSDPGVLLNEGLARWSLGDGAGADSVFGAAIERLGGYEKALDLLGVPRDRGDGRGRMERLSPEEIRQRLRLAAARVPRSDASTTSTKDPGPHPGPPVSKVSGSRAAGGGTLASAVYWMEDRKEASP